MFPAHPDGLSRQLAGVNPSHHLELVQSIIVILDEHKANFIHVGSQHNPQRIFHLCPFCHQYIAQGIHAAFICQWFYSIKNNCPDFALITGYGNSIGQPFQQGDLFHANLGEGQGG